MDEKEDNFYRFNRLCIRLGTKVVREKLNQILPPSNLPTELAAAHSLLVKSTRGLINPKQKDLLYPTTGITTTDNYDLTLMMIVFCHVVKISLPSSGLNVLPDAMDTSLGADLVRIKFYRNLLAHAGKNELESSEFTNMWKYLSEAIIRIGGPSYKEECDAMKNMTWNRDELIELKIEIQHLQEQVTYLQEQCVHCDCHDVHKMELEEWEENDKRFVNTLAGDHILQKLETSNVVTLIGQPGVGKSATAHHIALRLSKERGYKIIPCQTPKDIIQHYKSDHSQIFVIDDTCGKYTMSLSEVEDWMKNKKKLSRILKCGKAKLLVSCRLQIFQENQFQRVTVLVENSCNLSSGQFRLTTEERVNIAKMYFDDDSVTAISPYVDMHDFFPLLCKLHLKSPTDDPAEFFKNPFQVYRKQLDKLEKQHNRTKFCSLLLLVLCNGFVKESDLLTENLRNLLDKIFVTCGVNYGTPSKDISDQLDSLCNTYLTKEIRVRLQNYRGTGIFSKDKGYSAIHDKFFEFLCAYFGLKFQELILEFGNEIMICHRCILGLPNTPNNNFKITLDEKYEEKYVCKLVDFLLDGKFIEVLNQNNMKSATFEKKLVTKFAECSAERINTLLDEEDDCGRTLLYLVCRGGYTLFATFLISRTNDICAERFSDYPPLVAACESGEYEIVKILLEKGAEVDKGDCYGQTPLVMAVRSKSSIIVDALIQKHANISVFDFGGNSLLFIACELGCHEIVSLLLDAGIDTSKSTTKKEVTPLIRASIFGQTSIAKLLIEKGADVHLQDLTGFTPLHFAIYNNHEETAKYLIEAGADPEATDANERNALSLACHTANLSFVQFLIENVGMDVHQCDVLGRNLLWHVLDGIDESGVKPHLIRYLVSKKIDFNKPDKDFVYPLMLACEKSNTDIVELIFHYGGKKDLNEADINGQTSLMVACQKGKSCVTEYLISKGADINKANEIGETALMVACREIKTECIKVILNHPIRTDLTDEKGRTPMILACMSNFDYCEHIKPLIQYGFDLNQADFMGRTALMWSCYTGNVSAVQYLLNCPVDVNCLDHHCNSALFYAILATDQHIVCHQFTMENEKRVTKQDTIVGLLIAAGVDLKARDRCGKTLLFGAVKNEVTSILYRLLENGVSANLASNDGTTPLMYACQNGMASAVEMLLEKGSDINSSDHHIMTPLLIKKGADINAVDMDGTTALITACKFGELSVVELLIEKGADINVANKNGTTALMMACTFEKLSVVELLIKKGADINVADIDCTTALLMMACKFGELSVVEVLIKKGVDINIADKDGTTALIMACKFGELSVVELLIKKGADINIADKDGTTALMMPCKFSKI